MKHIWAPRAWDNLHRFPAFALTAVSTWKFQHPSPHLPQLTNSSLFRMPQPKCPLPCEAFPDSLQDNWPCFHLGSNGAQATHITPLQSSYHIMGSLCAPLPPPPPRGLLGAGTNLHIFSFRYNAQHKPRAVGASHLYNFLKRGEKCHRIVGSTLIQFCTLRCRCFSSNQFCDAANPYLPSI